MPTYIMGTGDTKKKILDAATVLVSEKGYLGATTRQIAHEARVTELTLFRHFGTKERLFEEVLNHTAFLPALKELLPDLEELPYEEALRTIGMRFLRSLKARKPMVKIMHAELCHYPDKIRKAYSASIDDTRRLLAEYFRSLRTRGVLRDVDPEVAATMLLGVLFSYFRTEEIMRDRDITKNRRMEQAVRGFVDIFVHGTVQAGKGRTKRRGT